MYNVLIVDDHPVLAGGLKSLLAEYGMCSDADIAVTGADCFKKLNEVTYDLMILDINLPDASGIDMCEKIHKEYPPIKILALTSFNEFTCVNNMMNNGASGYLLKNAMPEEIIKGVETVMKGEIFLCHEVDMLMKRKTEKHIYLTRREVDLLRLITEGFTYQEIADKLFLGSETVKSYRKNLLCKLNAKNTAALVRIAIEEKLV
ncbi:MAG TPA: response regulator transcription factor [Bacteroidales bacterium]|nr:response regulator transcription factor [Bacteroidales bacterium]